MACDYKSAYEWELSDWDRQRASVSTPLAITTLLGGLIGFALQQFEFLSDWLTWLFCVVAGLAMSSIGVAVYYMVKLIHGHTYKRIPRPQDLLAHYEELLQWHRDHAIDIAQAEESFDRHLTRTYAAAATHNLNVNARRSGRLFLTNRA